MGADRGRGAAGSLCVVDDFWFRYVADMGIAGPDKGQGGKYLFLPPGYDGEVPDGYFAYRSPTFTNWVVLRALGGVPDMKKTRIYPLAERRADGERVDQHRRAAFNTVHANDFSFYEEVDELVQEEPVESLDAERAGQLAAIGIVKGSRSRRTSGCGGSSIRPRGSPPACPRALATRRATGASLYGSWKNVFVGGSYEFLRRRRLLDARTQFHYLATVITPAMAHAQVGAGSAYAYTVHDANGDMLDGATYRLPSTPTRRRRTSGRSMCTTPRRGHCSRSFDDLAGGGSNSGSSKQRGRLVRPLLRSTPEGKESNWVETIPGKSWFQLFRIYGPLQPWFDQTWRLNEFEPIDAAGSG